MSLIILPKFTSAQSPQPPGVNFPPTLPETIEQTIPKPLPSPTPSNPTNPTAPILPSPGISTPSDTTFPDSDSFLVKNIEVVGATVLKNEIAKLIQPFQNRQVTFADLLKLRSDITELYIQNGYITSGAFLPNNQNLTDGVVKIQVVEGELENIEITGLRRLKPVYVRSRLKRTTSTLLNRNHTIPLNGNNDTLSFRFNNADSRIITDDFRELKIRSDSQTYSFNYLYFSFRYQPF